MGLIRRNPAPGTTGDGAPKLIKSATIDGMEFTPKPRIAQPDALPGRILLAHFLRADEWPGLNNSEVAA